MAKSHIKVGQMNKVNHRMGAMNHGNKSSGMKNGPSQQQIQETANEYNRYK